MKKYLIGAIFGLLLSFSVSVYAEEVTSLIGRAIEGQFPVKVNDQQLTNQAIVIDGTSYLPVRAIGDALNMEVGFDADLGITLKSKTKPVEEAKPTMTPSSAPVSYPQIPITVYDITKYTGDTGNSKLNDINASLQVNYNILKSKQIIYNNTQTELHSTTDSEKRAKLEEEISKYAASILAQEAKIADLEKRKAELESGDALK